MNNKQRKISQIQVIITDITNKNEMRYHFTTIRMTVIK